VLEKYPRQLKIVFKNFPLRNHKNAFNAALAALAAGQQGKFWEFHDALFKNYKQINEAKIQEIVTQLGLDKDQFEKQRKNPSIIERVNQDFKEGRDLGIRGIPTVYINGKRLKNSSVQGIHAAIEKELKMTQQKKQ
jgi:protein-disulfide isomerase